jgi:dTDP-4-amino-4,6-dideoxygalactose transaminase
MDTINGIAEKHNLLVIEDAAQSHGSIYKNKKAGTLSSAGCFSFYPTKNLGALGDGGAVVTDNKIIDTKLKILRNVGQAKKNIHIFKGYNSRLDEIQAAVLKVKLKHLDQWNNKRRAIASYYHHNLINKSIELLYDDTDSFSNYTLFTIYLKQRSKLYKYLDSHGVGSGIYYPTPIHLQPCLKQLGYKLGDFPQSEKLAKGALSIPVHQNLTDAEKRYVLDLLNKFK